MGPSKEKLPTLIDGDATAQGPSPVWLRIAAFLSLRSPNTQETYNLMEDFYLSGNFQKVQLNILATDEYAHF